MTDEETVSCFDYYSKPGMEVREGGVEEEGPQGVGVGRRPRSWGPEPGDALSWLLWQPYDVQCQSEPGRDATRMSAHSVSVVPVRPPTAAATPEQAPAIATVTATATATVTATATLSPQRTFISTEAQTDEVPPQGVAPPRRSRRRPQPPTPSPALHRLPDLLDSHLPPPYTAPPPPLPPPPHPFHHIVPSRRRGSVYREVPKSCCGLLSPAAVSLRWLMLLLLTVGVCCALVGTVLGATRATAPHHLTVALLMIGVGVVLVTVSGVAWRLMGQDAPSCRDMLGLSSSSESADNNRRFLPRLPPSYGRPHHPYAAMMYPEFQYRAPPPSYQASMQEYRLRLLLLDRHNAASPPPTYRSHPSTLLRGGLGLGRRDINQYLGGDYSRPPSYRSRTSSSRPELATAHSRQASSVLSTTQENSKVAEEPCLGLPDKENMVTIVQTGEEPSGPVIVTISGPDPICHHRPTDQMEILAHL